MGRHAGGPSPPTAPRASHPWAAIAAVAVAAVVAVLLRRARDGSRPPFAVVEAEVRRGVVEAEAAVVAGDPRRFAFSESRPAEAPGPSSQTHPAPPDARADSDRRRAPLKATGQAESSRVACDTARKQANSAARQPAAL